MICLARQTTGPFASLAWEQENVAEIFTEITSYYKQLSLKNTHIGADRISYEVLWMDSIFWLHFECYSQSIWFEALDLTSLESVDRLYSYLMDNS